MVLDDQKWWCGHAANKCFDWSPSEGTMILGPSAMAGN